MTETLKKKLQTNFSLILAQLAEPEVPEKAPELTEEQKREKFERDNPKLANLPGKRLMGLSWTPSKRN